MNLSKNVKVTQVLGYYAAGTTARKADIIDMQDYDGCMFIYELGTLLDTGTLDCFVSGDAVNNTAAMSRLLTTTAFTCTAVEAAYAKSCIVVDVFQPDPVLHRYLEATVTPAVANAVILGITAIQYNGRVHPDTNPATTLKSTFLQSPAE
jgi:hypothetical protein